MQAIWISSVRVILKLSILEERVKHGLEVVYGEEGESFNRQNFVLLLLICESGYKRGYQRF